MEIKLPINSPKKKKYPWQYILLIWKWGFKIGIQPCPLKGESFYDFETVWPKPKSL